MIKRIYQAKSLEKVFKHSQLMIIALSFTILSVFFIYISTITLESYARQNLEILSNALSDSIQPAVVFNDQSTIQSLLHSYTQQYPIQSIHIYNQDHLEIAQIDQTLSTPPLTMSLLDQLFFKQPVEIKILHNEKYYGTLNVYGNSSRLVDFFHKIILGLIFAFLIILATMFWLVHSIYAYLLKSIEPVVSTSKQISTEKNYAIRLPPSPIKEFQDINNVVNELLEKVDHSNQQLKNENDQLFHQAQHDELTKLPNRHFFQQHLYKYFHEKSLSTPALLFIDNNHFKIINDKYGHLAGDEVLKVMSQRLSQNLREKDFIARLGGDEFAILIHHIEDQNSLKKICERLILCANKPISFNNIKIYFSFSIGIAYLKCSSSPKDLIARADRAMYTAKINTKHWYLAPCDKGCCYEYD